VERIATALWRWTAYHEQWRRDVGCLAVEDGAALILIDPLVESWPAREALARG